MNDGAQKSELVGAAVLLHLRHDERSKLDFAEEVRRKV